MANPLISIMSAYIFNPHLFDDLKLPAELNTAEMRQAVIDGIISECDELQLVWSNPTLLQRLIGSWSTRRLPNWERYAKAFAYTYQVGDNYNMTETYEGTGTRHSESGQTYNSNNTGTSSDKNTANAYRSDTRCRLIHRAALLPVLRMADRILQLTVMTLLIIRRRAKVILVSRPIRIWLKQNLTWRLAQTLKH